MPLSSPPLQVDYRHRRIIVCGDIDNPMCAHMMRALLSMDDDANALIEVVLSSDGGLLDPALAVTHVMRSLHSPIRTFAAGFVGSSATLWLAAGDQGQRYLAKRAALLIHAQSAGFEGTPTDAKDFAEQMRRTRDIMGQTYAELSGQKVETFRKYLDGDDHRLTAKRALQLGLVDKLISHRRDMTPSPAPETA
ncbi:MAG: ATP-dependent Clp protease proteolytic subunit [Alphaproteobacteria bacterium]